MRHRSVFAVWLQCSTCVCDDGKIIQMCDQDGQHCSKFVKSCVAAPDGSLLEQASPGCGRPQATAQCRAFGRSRRRCGHSVRVVTVASAQANPTCNSGTYSGGLSCCAHGRIMLDTAQERRPELLRYHMKFRFWYQVDLRRRTPQRLQSDW
jgi:hypothetical protein